MPSPLKGPEHHEKRDQGVMWRWVGGGDARNYRFDIWSWCLQICLPKTAGCAVYSKERCTQSADVNTVICNALMWLFHVIHAVQPSPSHPDHHHLVHCIYKPIKQFVYAIDSTKSRGVSLLQLRGVVTWPLTVGQIMLQLSDTVAGTYEAEGLPQSECMRQQMPAKNSTRIQGRTVAC